MKPSHTQLLATALVAACITQAAFAHAFLDKSDPKVGAVLTTVPIEIKIWFTDDVVPDKSSIKVFNTDGKQIDKKDTHSDRTDKSLLSVSLPALSSGTYKVVWQALCPDSHITNGTYTFTVSAQSATQAH